MEFIDNFVAAYARFDFAAARALVNQTLKDVRLFLPAVEEDLKRELLLNLSDLTFAAERYYTLEFTRVTAKEARDPKHPSGSARLYGIYLSMSKRLPDIADALFPDSDDTHGDLRLAVREWALTCNGHAKALCVYSAMLEGQIGCADLETLARETAEALQAVHDLRTQVGRWLAKNIIGELGGLSNLLACTLAVERFDALGAVVALMEAHGALDYWFGFFFSTHGFEYAAEQSKGKRGMQWPWWYNRVFSFLCEWMSCSVARTWTVFSSVPEAVDGMIGKELPRREDSEMLTVMPEERAPLNRLLVGPYVKEMQDAIEEFLLGSRGVSVSVVADVTDGAVFDELGYSVGKKEPYEEEYMCLFAQPKDSFAWTLPIFGTLLAKGTKRGSYQCVLNGKETVFFLECTVCRPMWVVAILSGAQERNRAVGPLLEQIRDVLSNKRAMRALKA